MLSVSLPKSSRYEKIEKNHGKVIIEGCYPGYGTTLGNSLRRVLLSSLSGAAAVAVKIQGATHEFTTIKGVMEDVVQIILNLKGVRFRLTGVEEAIATLEVKGEKEVTAKDIKCGSEVEIVNPDHHIASLTSSSAGLSMEIRIQKGIGYVPVEQQETTEKEVGLISMDAIYTPIKRVNFTVENMRVGKRTDFERVILEIVTDGTISPQEAYQQAIGILMSQFKAISDFKENGEKELKEKTEQNKKELKEENQIQEKIQEKKEKEHLIEDLKFSTRTYNVLKNKGIKTAEELANFSEKEINDFEGMGEKGIKEIRKTLGSLGIILRKEE